MRLLIVFCLALLNWPSFVSGQIYSSRPVNSSLAASPYRSVGIVRAIVGRGSYRGSAAVARDHRLLYSCAHLVYENGRWASLFAFKRAHHSYFAPGARQYISARGYRPLAGYASQRSFDQDFVVAYGGLNRVFDSIPLAIHSDPISAVTSNSWKMVLGYPGDLDHVRFANTGRYWMYQSGPFTRSYEDYDPSMPGGEYLADWVTTGSGNSGGPLVVWDGYSYKLAGILVSGSNYYDNLWWSGVYVLGSESELVADDALGRSINGISTTRMNSRSLWIPNASKKWTKRGFDFKSAPRLVMDVKLDLSIYTGKAGDIEAYVRSPTGRTQPVAWPNPSNTEANVILPDHNVTDQFLYTDARGSWHLFFRDLRAGNPSWFQEARLKIRSRWNN